MKVYPMVVTAASMADTGAKLATLQGLDTSHPSLEIIGGRALCPGHYEESLGSMMCFTNQQNGAALEGTSTTRLHIELASKD